MKEKSNKKMMILSFIGIVLVVLGHTKNQFQLASNIFSYYSFHMALFIFISGYFYNESNEKNIRKYIFSKFKKLVIPYFIWNIVYGIILLIAKHFNLVIFGDSFNLYSIFVRPWVDGHQFHLNIASWFILALFLVNIIYILFRTLIKKLKLWNDYVFLIIFLLLSIISVKFSFTNTSRYLIPVLRTGFFMFFYHFGLIYKKIEKKVNINVLIRLLVIIVVQLIILKLDSHISYEVVFMNFNSKYLITPFLGSITGIMFWLTISEILVPALKNSKYVNYVSCHTKEIMFHHIFWIFVCNTIIYLLSSTLKLSGFNTDVYMHSVYYCYTAGVPQSAVLYTIVCINIPLLLHYIYEKKIKNYFRKMVNNEKK